MAIRGKRAEKAVLDWKPIERRVMRFHQEDGKNFIAGSQDAEPIIEWTKRRAQHSDVDRDWRFVATIPEETLNQAMLEGWFHDKKAWERWMTENPKFTAKYHKI